MRNIENRNEEAPVQFFIKNFIQKERKDRWNALFNSAPPKLYDNLNQLEKHLDKRFCVLVENNSAEIFNDYIKKRGIKDGFLYDLTEQKGDAYLFLKAEDIRDRSLLICEEQNVAFYFHDEGWIWFCSFDNIGSVGSL